MRGLTISQKQLLDFLTRYMRESGGVAPTYREMMESMALSSKSQIAGLLGGLERRGFIRRQYNAHRGIEIINRHGLACYSAADLRAELERRGEAA